MSTKIKTQTGWKNVATNGATNGAGVKIASSVPSNASFKVSVHSVVIYSKLQSQTPGQRIINTDAAGVWDLERVVGDGITHDLSVGNAVKLTVTQPDSDGMVTITVVPYGGDIVVIPKVPLS